MKTTLLKSIFLIGALALVATGCHDYEDEGPLQYEEESFSITDFDRLEIGDAFIIRVEQGNYFSVNVRGDRRNIDDMEVRKSGNTLIVRYDEYENHRHETYVDITMPTITAAVFSGASNSVITGFNDLETFTFSLSGASISQADLEATNLTVNLSGASIMDLRGEAIDLNAEISGASSLKAYNFPVQTADIRVSGASAGKITVNDALHAIVSGASSVRYRGNPLVDSDVSGASSLQSDN